MKKILLLLLLLIPVGVHAQSIKVEASGQYTGPLQTSPSPVVVELFSSQNCPACPPADEYIGELSRSKGVIALSCHVNYFGKASAGLGRQICTDRQTRYIEQIGRRSHFTPQMMVNGHMSEIGYETANVAAAIMKGRSERVQEISIKPKANNVFDFSIPAMRVNNKVEIWVAVYQKPKSVSSRGRNVTYSNAVHNYISLGVWRGDALTKVVSPVMNSNSAGFVVVAQEIDSGKIIAAGDYKL